MRPDPNKYDQAAQRWVRTNAPDDDYLPEPEKGQHQLEKLNGQDLTQADSETVALYLEGDKARTAQFLRAPAPTRSKSVKRRDGRKGTFTTTLTLEEYRKASEKPAPAPVRAIPVEAPPAVPRHILRGRVGHLW